MSKTVFQRYTTEAGEKYEFELTDEGVIYLFDRSTKSRTQLNESDRSAIERGLITIGDWESDSAAYQRTLDRFVKELKKAKHNMGHPVPAGRPVKKR
jgi:hypothetical protein